MKDNKDKLENEYKDNKKREIEFRAKNINDQWRYGYLERQDLLYDENYDCSSSIQIETLGQYTGLKDKNGKKIYEGDIIKSHYGSIYIVKYFADWGSFSLKLVFLNTEGKLSRATGRQHLYKNDCTRLEILGNIWDNLELLGGSDEECDN